MKVVWEKIIMLVRSFFIGGVVVGFIIMIVVVWGLNLL